MGGMPGARFALAGAEVLLVDLDADHVGAILADGLVVTFAGEEQLHRLAATTDPAGRRPVRPRAGHGRLQRHGSGRGDGGGAARRGGHSADAAERYRQYRGPGRGPGSTPGARGLDHEQCGAHRRRPGGAHPSRQDGAGRARRQHHPQARAGGRALRCGGPAGRGHGQRPGPCPAESHPRRGARPGRRHHPAAPRRDRLFRRRHGAGPATPWARSWPWLVPRGHPSRPRSKGLDPRAWRSAG